VFLANPNNPTGSYLSLEDLKRLRAGLREDVLFVIDAAYAEYVTAGDYDVGFGMVDDAANVVVTRSFSKIFGLGGARLGWAYCPPVIADVLNRIRMPFNVTAPTQAAGLAALEDTGFVAQARAHNTQWRGRLTQRLRGMGLTVPDSMGNFVLVRFPAEPGRNAEAADAFLRNHGLIVRRMAAYGLPDSLRITVGLEDEMQVLTDTLDRFMESA
jgi:histidinol-phosphate aminotransferase